MLLPPLLNRASLEASNATHLVSALAFSSSAGKHRAWAGASSPYQLAGHDSSSMHEISESMSLLLQGIDLLFTISCDLLLESRSASLSPSCNNWPGSTSPAVPSAHKHQDMHLTSKVCPPLPELCPAP